MSETSLGAVQAPKGAERYHNDAEPSVARHGSKSVRPCILRYSLRFSNATRLNLSSQRLLFYVHDL
jgi:hypothetical protein